MSKCFRQKSGTYTHKTLTSVFSRCGRVVLIALLQGDVTKVWRSTSTDEAEPARKKHVDNNLNGIEVMTMITKISDGFIVTATNQIIITNNKNKNDDDDYYHYYYYYY